MEGYTIFLQLIAQGCGNLAREEHLLLGELLLRFFILYYAILDKHNYYRLFLKIGNYYYCLLFFLRFAVTFGLMVLLERKSSTTSCLQVPAFFISG